MNSPKQERLAKGNLLDAGMHRDEGTVFMSQVTMSIRQLKNYDNGPEFDIKANSGFQLFINPALRTGMKVSSLDIKKLIKNCVTI